MIPWYWLSVALVSGLAGGILLARHWQIDWLPIIAWLLASYEDDLRCLARKAWQDGLLSWECKILRFRGNQERCADWVIEQVGRHTDLLRHMQNSALDGRTRALQRH